MLSFLSAVKAQEPVRSESRPLLDSISMVKRIAELEEKLETCGSKSRPLVDSLRKIIVVLQSDTSRLNGEILELQRDYGKLHKENEQLSVFKDALLAQLADKVVGRWTRLPYCQIDSIAFTDTLALYKKYKDDNPKVARAYDQLKTLDENLNLYWRAKRAVNSPYEAQTVKELVQPMKNLSESVKSQGNKKNIDEISELYSQLYNYKGTLQYFQEDIIKGKVESNIQRWQAGGESPEDAWILLQDDLPETDPYISKIPWLSEQYRAYYEQLNRDVYGANPARDIIMNIVP